jgi:leucyl aminopeptidase
MTNYADLIQPDNGQNAIAIHVVDTTVYPAWLMTQGEMTRNVLKAQKFEGDAHAVAILPGDKDAPFAVVAGVVESSDLGLWSLAKAADSLPEGSYRLVDCDAGEAMFGWMMAHYAFDTYREKPVVKGQRVLLTKEPGRIEAAAFQAEATSQVRDLVNRPAADCGPAFLESEARRIGKAYKADVAVVSGDALEAGYPMIHAVGKAAAREHAPRLIEIEWGDPRHPRIAIIGKGVTFDTGGLDLKPSAGMRLMKKDMGGAAHALALVDLIIKAHLPVRLHMLIAAVENSVSGNAMRPGDILKSRKGITVEIDNTDAEGRLVLADAMTKALESGPALMIDFATLTGAARTALGPELPALFANDDALADGLLAASKAVHDPIWRMPLWQPYDEMLASDIADTANSGGSFAGAVTAALFLKKFADENVPWAHLDTYAWAPSHKPGRPKGGEALGLRAVFRYLAENYPAR